MATWGVVMLVEYASKMANYVYTLSQWSYKIENYRQYSNRMVEN